MKTSRNEARIELNAIVLVAIVVLAVVAMLCTHRLMTNRAIRSVIRVLRQHSATTLQDAKTMDELGLIPKQIMDIERILKQPDYKPYALRILRNAGVIQATDDGRLYLDEGQLRTSRWSHAK